MDGIKRHPFLAGWFVLCAMTAGGGAGWLYRLRHIYAREVARLEQKSRDLDRFAQLVPAANPENEIAAKAALSAAERQLTESRAGFVVTAAPDPALAPLPANPVEAYFDLCAFVERMRGLAGQNRVGLKPNERFGFAAYAVEGPEAALLPEVCRQRRLLERLLAALFAAGPHELLAVERERPGGGASGPTRENIPDYFQPDPRLDLRVAGLLEGRAVRLRFSGETAVLRAFLIDLAASPQWLVVRRVEVEPAPPGEASTPGATSPAAAPFLTRNFSVFTVVVQAVEPVSAPSAVLP